MKKLADAMKRFEERNNISIYIDFHKDFSGGVYEYWQNRELFDYDSEDELFQFLDNTQYQLDENGLCISPEIIISK